MRAMLSSNSLGSSPEAYGVGKQFQSISSVNYKLLATQIPAAMQREEIHYF
jgi:hypothetical protein